jgi:hypothetical protein
MYMGWTTIPSERQQQSIMKMMNQLLKLTNITKTQNPICKRDGFQPGQV